MKKYILSFAALIMLLAVCSCNKEAFMDDSSSSPATRADENPWDIDFAELDTTYFVSDKDVEAYIHFKKLVAESEKRELEVREVVPLGLNDEATLAYLINYNEGWEIIAADKRAPAVLASNEKGSCNLKELPMNMEAWIQNMELDLLQLRACPQRPKWAEEESWQKMTESIRFWSTINAEEEFVLGNDSVTIGTRSLPSGHEITFPDLMGHWELVSVITREDVEEFVDHLISTHWHQYAPYNENCPEIVENSGNHLPAGSAAVSGASLLNFLHNTIGWPEKRPVGAKITGNYGAWTFDPSYLSTSGWALLSDDDNPATIQAVASYLAYVGFYSATRYDEIVSCGLLSSFASNLLFQGDEGVLYDHDDYSAEAVIESILNGSPVLAEIYQLYNFHLCEQAFLIDYYKKFRQYTSYYYEFIYDNPSSSPRPLQDSVRTVYADNYTERIRMKWGDNSGWDDTDFSLSASWNYYGVSLSTSQASIYYNFSGR